MHLTKNKESPTAQNKYTRC